VISSIEISHFRGIREGKLENLSPLTILVGPNGCGKSTVLDAMLIGASPTPANAILQVLQRHRGVVERGRWLFSQREGRTLEAEILLRADPNCERTTKLMLEPSSPAADSLETVSVKCQPSYRDPSIGTGEYGPNPIYVRLSPHKDAIEGHEVPPLPGVESIRLVEIHGNGSQRPLFELFSESTRMGQRENTRALIADLVPGLCDIEILTEAGKPILYLVFENGAIPVALSGDGIHSVVHVALELASLPAGGALLEEPEVHQHPGAMRQTARAILAAVRRNIQVVMTTHSLEFIDMLLAEAKDEDVERLSLYRLELDQGRLIAVRTPGPDVAFSRGEIARDLR
jgi:hypothetical protein